MIRLLHGDCRDILPSLEAGSVHTVVTSPPYYGLRDYGTAQWDGGDAECDHIAGRGGNLANSAASTRGGAGKVAKAQTVPFRGDCGKCGARRIDRQIGLEPTPDAYVSSLVGVFREVRRVLRDDGTVWLNLGDSYASSGVAGAVGQTSTFRDTTRARGVSVQKQGAQSNGRAPTPPGLKPKDLIGVPWRVAFALQADGWWLRQDIVWSKPSCMPESVTDRCTKAHEYVFLLAKSPRYFYDAAAIAEPAAYPEGTRNKRSVWTIATRPFAESHFATMPPELAETCIKAGCPIDGTCLDPFAGAGTTGLVADRLQRNAVLIDLNAEYAAMAQRRIVDDAPLFAEVRA